METLGDAVALYSKCLLHRGSRELRGVGGQQEVIFEYELVLKALRDSMIKRFSCCVDMLWKYIKLYLEEELELKPEIRSPKHIAREVGAAGLITEQETETLLDMIDSRNMTSHIYKEEIAEQLSREIPCYYGLMIEIIDAM